MRKICTLELLNANKVRSYCSIRDGELWHLIEAIRMSLGSPIKVGEKVSKLANVITCRATIGNRCEYQVELIKVVKI